jgi:hypothetical protein
VDDAGVGSVQFGKVEIEAPHDAWPEVLNNDIGLLNQPQEQSAPGGLP